ncbi:MBL fold metallo-hydrolase [Ferroacidibacillus organovorans]|uniref:Metallo-beta-lactamase domain-containing protein n=1 Tax=Ferroacidibacillus organovorans TaxID=1765683 RepID=A0A101XNT9_9BACL|nr:MBL fold metallo-hydrolase [Ferroacidibacillus organovorans]KUO94828.1 hypothetical protein ATW55_10490 [Ferroacidibacillus organovorans]
MLIQSFSMNAFDTNTYVIGVPGGDVLLIDPSSTDMSPVYAYIAQNQLHVTAIINTHCHIDHVLGNDDARVRYDVALYTHENELPVLKAAPDRGKAFFGVTVTCREPDRYIKHGEVIEVGPYRFTALLVPGHSPGSLVFYEAREGVLISGDTLFAGSIGRTDLPFSNPADLERALREVLWPLPDETIVYPGHGVDTTIGEERQVNPFFQFGRS